MKSRHFKFFSRGLNRKDIPNEYNWNINVGGITFA